LRDHRYSAVIRCAVVTAAVAVVAPLTAFTTSAASSAAAVPAAKYYALGDSYSSGEGVPPFDPKTDIGPSKKLPAKDLCHRSKSSAYPTVYAATAHNTKLAAFTACSGAVEHNVVDSDATAVQYPLGHDTDNGQISALAKHDATLVTVTMGGNDAHFAQILQDCLTPFQHCDLDFNGNSGQPFNEVAEINNLLGSLYNGYLRIKAQAPKAKVVVLTYPQIFDQPFAGCFGSTDFDASEVAWIRARTSQLDSVIKQAAAAAGVTVLDEENAFGGHGICDAPSWVNGEDFTATSGWFHPNQTGQLVLATDLRVLVPG
jgi:lysophospholipase L1-like esterase